jgi:hypothetical protein
MFRFIFAIQTIGESKAKFKRLAAAVFHQAAPSLRSQEPLPDIGLQPTPAGAIMGWCG